MNKKEKVKYFEERVRHYFFDVFKMAFFDLFVDKHEDKEEKEFCAMTYQSYGGAMISIFYYKTWIERKDLAKDEISHVAFHEVCEALLSDLIHCAQTRFVTYSEIDAARHRIINILENIVMEKL